MLNFVRIGFALAGLLLGATQAVAQAQENGTVGPSEIRDFSLPGSRPSAPAEAEPEPRIEPLRRPAEVRPVPASPPNQEPVLITPPAPRADARPPNVAVSNSAPASPGQPRPGPAAPTSPSPSLEVPAEAPAVDAAPAPLSVPEVSGSTPVLTPAPAGPPITAPAPAPSRDSGNGFPWLWALLALVVGAGLFAASRLRREKRTAIAAAPASLREPRPAPQPVPDPAPAPEPATAPTPPVSSVPGIVMRPWLEIEFRPERALATSEGAEVRYDLIIRNTGNAPARNVRLAARMFSAGPELDREIAAFFGRPINSNGSAPLTIPPRSEVALTSVVAAPRSELREITMQGRNLFVPTVAFNLLYDWGRDKTGQTCSSHVVGREAQTPQAKMGPFRLDLGPRVWRSVGQRPSALARAV